MSILQEETLAPPAREPRPSPSELWQRYHGEAPGGAAEEEIVRKYLPLVKTVVGRLALSLPAHVDTDDLHSAGLVGLLNAVRNYDARCGTAFETYARVRIRGAVLDELRRMDWVPRSVHAKVRKVQAAMQHLERLRGRIPTEAEVAQELGLSASDYEAWMEEIRPVTFVCLDSAQHAEQADGPAEHEGIADRRQESPDVKAQRQELARLIAQRLEQLPEMQRKVLALYYFEDLRLREIAEVFGLTESRICQIHSQAILAIKSFLQSQGAIPA